jgi:hypothetical protein
MTVALFPGTRLTTAGMGGTCFDIVPEFTQSRVRDRCDAGSRRVRSGKRCPPAAEARRANGAGGQWWNGSGDRGSTRAGVAEILTLNRLGGVEITSYNLPIHTLLSEPLSDLKRGRMTFGKAGARSYLMLPVSAAFHSRHMLDAVEAFDRFLGPFMLGPLTPRSDSHPAVGKKPARRSGRHWPRLHGGMVR